MITQSLIQHTFCSTDEIQSSFNGVQQNFNLGMNTNIFTHVYIASGR